jgi:hypothetical protein
MVEPKLTSRAHLARTIAKELPPEQLELLAGALRVLAREKREQRLRDFEVLGGRGTHPVHADRPGGVMDVDPNTLTSVTLTIGERVKLARCVVMATAMVDALGDDVGHLMELAERISPTEGGEW